MSPSSTDSPSHKLPAESEYAYKGFLCYNDTRDVESAYKKFLQENLDARASMKAFVGWASQYKWQARVNDIDAENELATVRETRRAGLDNNLTAESVAKELFTTCMEEMALRKGELTHRDIGKYLDIATKINERWVDKSKDVPAVVVNVDANSDTVEIDPETLRKLGREIAMEDDQ